MTDRPNCLIVSTLADDFAEEIARLAEFPVTMQPCSSAGQALAEYSGETILFGSPGMIAEVLPLLHGVRWIQSSWAGITPLMKLDRRDYVLTGVKGVFGQQISEYVVGYMLAHELKILQRERSQRERGWLRSHSGTMAGKRLGIMGTGSIGQHIARTVTCLGVKVTGLSRSGTPVPGFDNVMSVARLQDFLQECDYLVSTLPHTCETDHLLDAAALSMLPTYAYFINVGRSNVVDDAALIVALTNNKLAGAALDVFDDEPIPKDSRLWDAPNLSITAHIAAISHPLLIVPIFIENYRRYINKQPLKHVIDFDRGY